MKIIDILQETYGSISGNKVRSGLTILGIVVGISSVIAMISIGQGASSSIQSSIESMGSNLITISPGAQRGIGSGGVSQGAGSQKSLTEGDSDAIAKITGVKNVAPQISSRYQVTTKGYNTNTSVIGTVPAYTNVRSIEMEEGSFITDQNIKSISKVAVIGSSTRSDLFGEGVNPIGKMIRIKQIEFKVIGITKAKGGSGFGNQDDMVIVPLSTAERYLAGNSYLSTIAVEAESTDVMTNVQEQITSLLLDRHNVSVADFSVMNQADMVSAASGTMDTLTALLAAIAGISLIVGGIGIMNMMLTTVTERTREIGLRKAIGAKRKDISLQFLIESVSLTFIGGFIGVILGCLIAYGFSYFGIIQTSISAYSIFLAFGVSALIGIVFGYYPATRAAKLNPIEALRYE